MLKNLERPLTSKPPVRPAMGRKHRYSWYSRTVVQSVHSLTPVMAKGRDSELPGVSNKMDAGAAKATSVGGDNAMFLRVRLESVTWAPANQRDAGVRCQRADGSSNVWMGGRPTTYEASGRQTANGGRGQRMASGKYGLQMANMGN